MSSSLDASGDHPMDESPCKSISTGSGSGSSSSTSSSLSSARQKQSNATKITPQSKRNSSNTTKKTKPSLAPPMGFTPSPSGPPPPPPPPRDANDENKGLLANKQNHPTSRRLGFGKVSPFKKQHQSNKQKQNQASSPSTSRRINQSSTHPIDEENDELSDLMSLNQTQGEQEQNQSVHSILANSPSYITVDDLASIIVVQSFARRWMTQQYILPYVKATSPRAASSSGGDKGTTTTAAATKAFSPAQVRIAAAATRSVASAASAAGNTSVNVSCAPSTPSPVKCRTLLSGNMTDVSQILEQLLDDSRMNDTTISQSIDIVNESTDEVNLSNVAANFDDKLNAIQAKQMDKEEMARKRRTFVENAMKSRFAINSANIAADDIAGDASNIAADTSNNIGDDVQRRGSTDFGTPSPKGKRSENNADSPDSCPSVPSVGLSRMVDDYNFDNDVVGCGNNNDNEADPNISINSSINTTATGISPSNTPNGKSPRSTTPSMHGNGSRNKLPGETSIMFASYCDISAIPEHDTIEHGYAKDDRVSPSKINFNDMLSICEEQDEDTDASESRMEMSMSHFSSGGLNSSRTSSNGGGKRMPSACNESNDLSAMCDYVMERNNNKRADVSTSSVDTSIDIDAARAAVRDESMYAPPPTPMIVSPGNKGLMNQSTCSNGNMIAHESASELDMRGVSIFNHSSDQLLKPGHVKSHQYSYPPTDSSSGTPLGSSMPSTDSYDYEAHHKDVDRSAVSDYTLTDTKQKCSMGSKLCLIITVPIVVGVLFGLVWFAFFTPNGWFTDSQAPSNVNVQQGDGGGIDTTSTTASPTTAPTWAPLPDVLQFEPETTGAAPKPAASKPVSTSKPTKAPTKAAVAARPKPSPAPAAFRGHETFSFYVIGDVPYTRQEEAIVEYQIKNMAVESVPYLDNEGAQFVVHVGDIMKGGNRADCSKWRYEQIEDMYKDHCPVPAFMLPGDNDWVDCPSPTKGWDNWLDSFAEMEMHWDGTTSIPSRVRRQSVRRENFSFHHGGVLFIGANLVSKEPYDIKWNYKERMNQNRDWVRQVVQQYRYNAKPSSSDAETIRAIVFFGHHRQSQFWRSLQDDLEDLDVPLIYFHGNGHEWYAEQPFSDWSNFWISQVDMGSIAPPIRVTIQGTTDIAQQNPLRKLSPYHIMLGNTIHVDRRGGTIKGPWSTSSFG